MGEKIYLKNNQGALVLGDDGMIELHLPKKDDPVPDFVTPLTIISILLKTNDEDFRKYVLSRWDEIVKNYDSI